jgi:type II secretory pathway pseudopilin PulG
MRRRRSARPGVVLLETLVALAILGAAGAALATLAVGATDAVRRAERLDDDVRRASAFLDVVALWPRADLDRHLGAHPQGEWILEVQHIAPALYTVGITDSGDARPLLRTALYRAEPYVAPVDLRAP